MLITAVLLFAISGPVPQWTLTDATALQARPMSGGVRITANVTLKNACWEAEIHPYTGVAPAEYQIVTRTKPEDVGKMCTRAVVQTTLTHWFPIKQQSITVRTMKGAQSIPVKP